VKRKADFDADKVRGLGRRVRRKRYEVRAGDLVCVRRLAPGPEIFNVCFTRMVKRDGAWRCERGHRRKRDPKFVAVALASPYGSPGEWHIGNPGLTYKSEAQ
jgi:hypothetical protein